MKLEAPETGRCALPSRGGSHLHVVAGATKSGEDVLDGLVDAADAVEFFTESRLAIVWCRLPVRSRGCRG